MKALPKPAAYRLRAGIIALATALHCLASACAQLPATPDRAPTAEEVREAATKRLPSESALEGLDSEPAGDLPAIPLSAIPIAALFAVTAAGIALTVALRRKNAATASKRSMIPAPDEARESRAAAEDAFAAAASGDYGKAIVILCRTAVARFARTDEERRSIANRELAAKLDRSDALSFRRIFTHAELVEFAGGFADEEAWRECAAAWAELAGERNR